MRPVNLLVLAQGFQTVPHDFLGAFEAQLSEREEPLSSVKSHEADSVVQLTHAPQRKTHQAQFVYWRAIYSTHNAGQK